MSESHYRVALSSVESDCVTVTSPSDANKLGQAIGKLVTENAHLKSEVERLRKAGDAMATIIKPPAHGTGEWDGEYDAWFAAKEVQK